MSGSDSESFYSEDNSVVISEESNEDNVKEDKENSFIFPNNTTTVCDKNT